MTIMVQNVYKSWNGTELEVCENKLTDQRVRDEL